MFLNEINAGYNLGNSSIARDYEKGISLYFGSLQMRPSSDVRIMEYKIFKSFIQGMIAEFKATGFIFNDDGSSDSRYSCVFCGWDDESDLDAETGMMVEEESRNRHIRIYDGKTGVSMHWYPFSPLYNQILEIATYEIDDTRECQNELEYRQSTEGIKFLSTTEEFVKGTSMDEDSFLELINTRIIEWRDNLDLILTPYERNYVFRFLRFLECQIPVITDIKNRLFYRCRITKLKIQRSNYGLNFLSSKLENFMSNTVKMEVK